MYDLSVVSHLKTAPIHVVLGSGETFPENFTTIRPVWRLSEFLIEWKTRECQILFCGLSLRVWLPGILFVICGES